MITGSLSGVYGDMAAAQQYPLNANWITEMQNSGMSALQAQQFVKPTLAVARAYAAEVRQRKGMIVKRITAQAAPRPAVDSPPKP